MGLFSRKTIISVASSVYNLAGDEKDRPIFLQNLVIRNILSGTKKSLGDTISVGHLQGPGIKFRNFYRWALENYDLIGMPTGKMYAGDVIPTGDVADEIPHAANENVWVQQALLGDSDYSYWAEQYMLENHPDLYSSEWEADMDDATKTIKIKFQETTPAMPDETFVASGFNSGDKYIFAYYTISQSGTAEPVEQGTSVSLGSDPFPDVTDYSLDTDNTTPRTETLTTETTVVKSWSDGRPNETSHTTSTDAQTVNRRVRAYSKLTYMGNDPDSDAKISRKDIRRLVTDKKVVTHVTTDTDTVDIGGGVTRTTTTIVTEDELEQNNSYRDDTQKIYETKWQQMKLFIYKIGSGNNALDNLVSLAANYGKFFPMIPFRLDNKFVSELATNDTDGVPPDWQDIYDLCVKAFRKGTDGGRYTKIQADLEDSENLKDMDYIYAVYGVSLNVIDRSARRYIYEFFKRLQNDQVGGKDSGTEFATKMAEYQAAFAVWLAWKNSNNGGGWGHGYIGNPEPEPPLPPKPTLPTNEIKIQSLGAEAGTVNINYDIRISWNFISEGGDHNGKGKAGARKNDVWLEYRGKTSIADPTYVSNYYGWHNGNSGPILVNNHIEYETIRIWWQFETNKYRYIDVAGLVHKNYIYGGKSVTITAKEALEDGEESGFLVPLHYATFRAMPLIHSTQMSTACVFLVINCYEKKKQKWWQSWFFKILFVIVVAIISVVFTGGAGIGLLGSHMAVGSALGLSGMGAAIAGSIANALAALVLTTIIEKVTASLGVFGAILGAVLGIVLGGAIQNFSMGQGFTFNFSDLMRADNILKLMDAAGQGYSAYVQASINSMQDQLVKLQEETNSALRDIREQYVEQFGYGGGQIDPMMFTSAGSPVKNVEMRDTFLARTLMTGSDVAGMSMDLLNNMADLTLSLPNAFNN